MTIEEILGKITEKDGSVVIEGAKVEDILRELKEKTIILRPWNDHSSKSLIKEYEPEEHPVADTATYQDVIRDGMPEKVTRVTLGFQKLATKRMTELVCGIPVKRVYKAKNSQEKEVAQYMERIFTKARIDSVNNERLNQLFASCEVATFWYAVKQKNSLYGFDSDIRLRCRTFSPMQGDKIYPLFDEYGDMVALSIEYMRKVLDENITYFDTYTSDSHLRFSDENGWHLELKETIKLGKIPAIYMYRPTPIWEHTSQSVYEMEWALSRNGNYLRENSKPLLVVNADAQISYGDEQSSNKEFKCVAQFPSGSTVQYVTWNQAVDNLKYHITELRQMFFTQLQLPDWSYENMKSTAMSGESRKQLFIDCQLKVTDESGRLLEFFDREVNVVKGYLKMMLPSSYTSAIDALEVENVITPYQLNDEKDTISNLTMANGNKPLMSHRESIELFGKSEDVDKTLEEIANDSKADVFEPTI